MREIGKNKLSTFSYIHIISFVMSVIISMVFVFPAESRMYDPAIGRFLQRDTIGYEDGMNLYAYVHNNPTNYVDPYGEFAILPLLPLIYAGFELGLSAWDAYSTGSTLLDPCASKSEKALSSGLFIIGALAPGGGYSTGGKVIGRTITGFTRHGLNQAISRGVRPAEILNAVRSPKVIREGYGGVTHYLGPNAEIRVSPRGEVITVIRYKPPSVP